MLINLGVQEDKQKYQYCHFYITLLLCFSAIILSSCSAASIGFNDGYTSSQYQGRWWIINENDLNQTSGYKMIKSFAGYDRTIRDLLELKGLPDYVYVENTNRLDVAYLLEGKVYSYKRSGSNTQSTLSGRTTLAEAKVDNVGFAPKDDGAVQLVGQSRQTTSNKVDLKDVSIINNGDARREVSLATTEEKSSAVTVNVITKKEWSNIICGSKFSPGTFLKLATNLLDESMDYNEGHHKKQKALQSMVLSLFTYEQECRFTMSEGCENLLSANIQLFSRFSFSEKVFVESLKNLGDFVERSSSYSGDNWITLPNGERSYYRNWRCSRP